MTHKMSDKKIFIKKFTVFENEEISFCNGINVIIGENGTGKTQLLKLLYMESLYRSSNSTFLCGLPMLFGADFNVGNCVMSSAFADDAMVASGTIQHEDITLSANFEKSPAGSLFPYQSSGVDSSFAVESRRIRPPIFIPTKDMLTMPNITRIADKYKAALDIDFTLTEIIKKAENIIPATTPEFVSQLAQNIEGEIGGTVHFNENRKIFQINKTNGSEIPFSGESEGYKKLGLLWRLLMNESITEDTLLLWDEPEANISPKLLPLLVHVLLELAKRGVQIIITTHEYNLARYFDIREDKDVSVLFHNFCKVSDTRVSCYSSPNYLQLPNNLLEKTSADLFNAVVTSALEVQGDE